MNDLFEDQDDFFSCQKEWQDMPEYAMEDLTPFRSIKVSFRNEEDVKKFEELMQQVITPKQKTIWFPFLETRKRSHLRYVDDES